MSEGWDKLWAEKKVFDLEKLLSEKEAECLRVRKALEDLLEPHGECEQFDHHGYCQSHFVEPQGQCRVKLGREVLKRRV